MKNVGSECLQPLVTELNIQPLKNLCESRLVKITSFVIALLALVGGITLTALAGAGILSFLPWLVLGIVLVVLCALFLLFSYKFCPIKELGVFYNADSQINRADSPINRADSPINRADSPINRADSQINRWFQEQRNKDLEKAKENPVLFGENRAADNGRSARSQVKDILRECDGNALQKIYRMHLDVLLFMNWAPKTMDDVDPASGIDIRTVIACYKLIKACQSEFRPLISELLGAIRCGLLLLNRCSIMSQERAKTVSNEDAPLFCLTHSYYRDGYLTPLRAGPRYMINSYIHLRRRENPKHFFSPKHPCYYARLAFNESVCVYRKLFDIKRLTKMYTEGDYDPENKDNLKSILDFVKTLDEGNDFLIEHKDTTYVGRDCADVFCS